MPDFYEEMNKLFGWMAGFRGDVIGRDEFDVDDKAYSVDTCFTHDTGKYETAVRIDGKLDWVVVEYYGTAAGATEGHQRWVDQIQESGETFFLSKQDGCIYGFLEED